MSCRIVNMQPWSRRCRDLNIWKIAGMAFCLPDLWLLSLLIIILTKLSDLILIIRWLIKLNVSLILVLILSWSGWLSLLFSRWLRCFDVVCVRFNSIDKICVICKGSIYFISRYQHAPHGLHNILQRVVRRITPVDNAKFGFSFLAEQWNGRLAMWGSSMVWNRTADRSVDSFSRLTSVEIHPGVCCLGAPGPNRLSGAGFLWCLHRCSGRRCEHCCAVSLVITELSKLLSLKSLCLRDIPSGWVQSPHHW